MAMGECSAYSNLSYRRTRRSSLQLGQRVGGHLALANFHSEDPTEYVHRPGITTTTAPKLLLLLLLLL